VNSTKIIGIETANPPLKLTQEEVWASIQYNKVLSDRENVYYKRFLGDPNIQSRYVGIPDLKDIFHETPDQSIKRFEKFGTLIGVEAVRKCLQKYEVRAQEIDALIVTTCTGYLCPGLTSYVAEKVGFNSHIEALDLVGLGCGAAIPALRTADDFLKNHPDSNVIVLCVEICTAAISWGEEIDLILSNILFGDGAAACLLSNKNSAEGVVIKDFHSILWPQYRDELRFEHKNSRLCNVIKKEVPGIAARAVKETMSKLACGNTGTIRHYAVHPGGRKILDEIEDALEFKNNELAPSREILRDYGNMSSPSVLFVLKQILEKGNVQDKEQIALFAFGAGFTAFGALVEVCDHRGQKQQHLKEGHYAKSFI